MANVIGTSTLGGDSVSKAAAATDKQLRILLLREWCEGAWKQILCNP
jgi:hypothetical protein